MPKIAVVIVNYNGLNDTIECIRSIYKSTISIKVIVVDNASKNNEALSLVQLFPQVHVIQSNQNLGFAGGNNLGIKWALDNNYEYIALLNNDTIVNDDTFEILIDEAKKELVTMPYMFYFYDKSEIWFNGGFINKFTGNAECKIRKNNNNFINGCCFCMHKKIWETTGLLDDSYFMYNEDTEFSLRLCKIGIKCFVIPQSIIYHKVGKSSGGGSSPLSIYYITRNRIRCIKKYPYFFCWTALPFTIITRFMWMLKYFILRKKEWRYFYKGVCDGLKGIGGKVDL